MQIRKTLFLVVLSLTALLALATATVGAKNRAGAGSHHTNNFEAFIGLFGGFLCLFVAFYGILAGVLFRDIHLPSFAGLGSMGVWLMAADCGAFLLQINEQTITPGHSAVAPMWPLGDVQFACSLATSFFMILSIGISFGAPSSTDAIVPGAADYEHIDYDSHGHGYEAGDQQFRTGAVTRRISKESINRVLFPFTGVVVLFALISLSLAAALLAQQSEESDPDAYELVKIASALAITGSAVAILTSISTFVCRRLNLTHRVLKPGWVYLTFSALWFVAAAVGTLGNEMYKSQTNVDINGLYNATFAFQCLSSFASILGIALFSFF